MHLKIINILIILIVRILILMDRELYQLLWLH
jgi:hypothetical protein